MRSCHFHLSKIQRGKHVVLDNPELCVYTKMHLPILFFLVEERKNINFVGNSTTRSLSSKYTNLMTSGLFDLWINISDPMYFFDFVLRNQIANYYLSRQYNKKMIYETIILVNYNEISNCLSWT